MDQQVDVVVVGAGPVGLLTALELALRGTRVLVLERLAAPSMDMKAGGLGPLGLEALERRGMATDIAAAEARSFAAMAESGADPRAKGSKYSGHFAGLSLIRKTHRRSRNGVPVPWISRPSKPCWPTARSLWGSTCAANVTSQASSSGRTASTWNGQLRQAHTISAAPTSSVATGDAASSARGPALTSGTEPSSTFYQAVAQIDHPERLAPMGWRRTSGGVFSYGPFPGRLVMLEFSGPPEDRKAPVTREEIEDVLRRVSGADVRVKSLESGSRWTDNTRLVDTYRKGRVLLAGDAAHIHTPFGGQGLTLGLVDAANLGWKLAAVIRSEMPESLLDTYTTERRPVAEAVLANTLAQIAIMRPDPQSGAMRDLVAKLLDIDDVNRFIGEMTRGLSTRYGLGSELDDVGRLIGDKAIRHGDADASLYKVMQDGMGVLLDASTEGKLSELVAAATQRIRCVGVDKGPSMLIRPDACIAWAGEENNTDGLEDALRGWFIPALDDGFMVRSEQ